MKSLWHRLALPGGVLTILCLVQIINGQDSLDTNRYNPQDPFNRYSTPSSNIGEFGRTTSSYREPFGNSVDNQPFGGGTANRDFENRDRPTPTDRSRDRNRDRQRTNSNPFSRNSLFDQNLNNPLISEATYFVVASRMVRPNQIYRVSVSVNIDSEEPLTVSASISR